MTESRNILIISADESTRRYIGYQLTQQGYQITAVATGKEGLIAAWRDLPDAIIIDLNISDISGLEIARKLRKDRRTNQKPILAISDQNRPEEMLNSLEAGFDQYITKSKQAIQKIIRFFGQRFHNIAENSSFPGTAIPEVKEGIQIVFTSAKGGLGTSSLCANLANIISENHPESRCAMIDMVLPIGSIATIVGQDDQFNLVTVSNMPPENLTTRFFTQELPIPDAWQFRLLPGSPDPDASNQLKVNQLAIIMKTIRQSFDYVFIDIGRTISPRISLPMLVSADQIALVLNSNASTVNITKTVKNYLVEQGVTEEQIFPILNRSVGLQGLTKTELERVLKMKVRGAIPYMHENFSLANHLHLPVPFKFPHYTATVAMHETAIDMDKRAIAYQQAKVAQEAL